MRIINSKALSVIAIVVLIAGIIFAFIGHGARTGTTVAEPLADLKEAKNNYMERFKDHITSFHSSDSCYTCENYTERLESYDEEMKPLKEAQTASLMEALGSCLWYVIGCGILLCVAKATKDYDG